MRWATQGQYPMVSSQRMLAEDPIIKQILWILPDVLVTFITAKAGSCVNAVLFFADVEVCFLLQVHFCFDKISRMELWTREIKSVDERVLGYLGGFPLQVSVRHRHCVVFLRVGGTVCRTWSTGIDKLPTCGVGTGNLDGHFQGRWGECRFSGTRDFSTARW